jgi:hypothetical protein
MELHALPTLNLEKIHLENQRSAVQPGMRLWKREKSLACAGKLTPISYPSSQ